jgi:hypothetical protein
VNYPVPDRNVAVEYGAQVHRTRQRWLDPGRVPLGLVTVLSGYGGLGKSQWTLALAGRVTRGELGDPAPVLIATSEDSIAATVKPRLEAVQADPNLYAFIKVQTDDGLEDGISLPEDIERIEEQIHAIGAKLLIVDPLVAHLPGDVDSHKDQSVRRALAPLYRMAQATDSAVVVTIHLNKASGMNPLQRLSGSGAFGNAARSVLLLDRDPDDPDGESGSQRVVAHIKCNVGPEMPSLLYRVEPILLPATTTEPEVATSRLELIGESPHSGSALLNVPSGEERTAIDEAMDFLRAELEDGARHPAGDVYKEARKVGLADRTLKRARQSLGVETEKAGFGRGWEWWLPKGPSLPGKPAFLHEGAVTREVAPSVVPSENGSDEEQLDWLGTASMDELREYFQEPAS